MVEVVKVMQERVPALRFIGKRYTDSDRDRRGGFSERWDEWFRDTAFFHLRSIRTCARARGRVRRIDALPKWV